MENKYIYLFANCVPVKGFTQSVICDLQREKYDIIPNSLYEIILNLKNNRDLNSLRNDYEEENQLIFDTYIDFLIDEEYVFIDNTLHNRLGEIDFEFDKPNNITNAIIEIDTKTDLRMVEKTIVDLDNQRCISVELRFHNNSFIERYQCVLDLFNETGIRSIYLLFNHCDNLNFEELSRKYQRIRQIEIFKFNGNIEQIDSPFLPILISKQELSNLACGSIRKCHFSINLTTFSEGVSFNTCLNRKIAIDVNGNVKNCPSMPQSHGNVNNIKLNEIIQNNNFNKFWKITKDQIEICRDCEYRRICTDCRAFTEKTKINDQGIDISKPLKCGYDPYSGIWNEWSTNPHKQKAIRFYGLNDLIEKAKCL